MHSTSDGGNASSERPQVLPFNEDAEMAVLGSVVISPQAIDAVADFLTPADFYGDNRRTIFAAMLALYARGEPPDVITVYDELVRTGKAEQVGGVQAVSSLSNNVPNSNHIDHYARIVRDHAIDRERIRAAEEIHAACFASDREATARAQARMAAADARADATAAGPRFKLLTDEEAEDMAPAAAVLGDIMHEGEIIPIFGDSDTYKTFLALSMDLSIAAGIPWFGRPSVQGVAVYVAAEAPVTIGRRVTAWKHRHGITERLPFYLTPNPVNLMDHSEVRTFIADTRRQLGSKVPRTVTFDTLAASMEGNPNDDEAINHVYAALRMVRDAFPGCVVKVVDHVGKDAARGMAGSAKKRANCDASIQVSRESGSDSTIVVHCDKVKDRAKWPDIRLAVQVEKWMTQDGETRDSLVFAVAAGSAKTSDVGPVLSVKQRQALDALTRMCRLHPDGISRGDWMRAAGLAEGTFKWAVKTLGEMGMVYAEPVQGGPLYRLTGQRVPVSQTGITGQDKDNGGSIVRGGQPDNGDNNPIGVVPLSLSLDPEVERPGADAGEMHAASPASVGREGEIDRCVVCGLEVESYGPNGAPYCDQHAPPFTLDAGA